MTLRLEEWLSTTEPGLQAGSAASFGALRQKKPQNLRSKFWAPGYLLPIPRRCRGAPFTKGGWLLAEGIRDFGGEKAKVARPRWGGKLG